MTKELWRYWEPLDRKWLIGGLISKGASISLLKRRLEQETNLFPNCFKNIPLMIEKTPKQPY